MWQIKSDTRKNRLYMTLTGIDEKKLADEVYLVAGEIRKLKPGFTCVTQIIEDRPVTAAEDRYIRLIQEFLGLMQVSKVVRVAPASMHEQFDQRSRASGGYSADSVNTVEEADRILDDKVETD